MLLSLITTICTFLCATVSSYTEPSCISSDVTESHLEYVGKDSYIPEGKEREREDKIPIILSSNYKTSEPEIENPREALQITEEENSIYISQDQKDTEVDLSTEKYSLFNKHELEVNPYKFNTRQIIIPGVMIGVGAFGLTHWWKKNVNLPIKDALGNKHHKYIFDDYLMWVPGIVGYGMNLVGIRGMHDIVDATILYVTTGLLLAATTIPLKYSIDSERPNLENKHSFPSGHTSLVFACAELLRKEYWHVSPWIGIGGYAIAAVTGFMRLYNNAHWFNDVLAGAGLGILCARAAYWLYPVITKTFFKKRYKINGFLSPSLSPGYYGLVASLTF